MFLLGYYPVNSILVLDSTSFDNLCFHLNGFILQIISSNYFKLEWDTNEDRNRKMRTTKPNKEIIKLLKKGDRVAFYNIYEWYCKRLYGFVWRYVKIEEDADEIVQDVFLKIWETRSKIDIYSSFESFLFTITYNTTISLLRKRVNEKKYLNSLQIISEAPDITNELYFTELSEQVNDLLDKLTPRQKEIFLLSRKEGLTQEEIAKKLNISLNTVKKHMTNSLSFLKSHIDSNLIVSVFFVSIFI